jgi:hypothetical protein
MLLVDDMMHEVELGGTVRCFSAMQRQLTIGHP